MLYKMGKKRKVFTEKFKQKYKLSDKIKQIRTTKNKREIKKNAKKEEEKRRRREEGRKERKRKGGRREPVVLKNTYEN